MQAKYRNGDNWEEQPVNNLLLTLDRDEVEQKTGMTSGCNVADVDVDNRDGTYARFYLSVRINKRGQPVFEVATSRAEGVVSKSVVGAKRKRQD